MKRFPKAGTVRLVIALAVVAVAATHVLAGDWKNRVAGKVIGELVEEGIEDAVEDAALDAALDMGRAAARTVPGARNVDDLRDIGDEVVDGVETAMRVADIAERLDDASDAIENINRLRRLRR